MNVTGKISPLLIFAASCSTTSAYIERDVPPKLQVKKDEKILVEPLAGHGGSVIAQTIQSALAAKKVQVLDNSNFVDKRTAKLLRRNERQQKASLEIGGTITQYSYQTFTTPESYECANGQYGTLYKTTGIGIITGQVNFTNIKSGRLVHSELISEKTDAQTTYDTCHGDLPTQPNPELVMSKARQKFAEKVLQNVTPYPVLFPVTLFKYDDDLLPELDAGHELFEDNKLEAALKQYGKAVARAKKDGLPNKAHAHALFSYGMTQAFLNKELTNNYLEEALRLNPNEEEEYEDAKSILLYFTSYNSQPKTIR